MKRPSSAVRCLVLCLLGLPTLAQELPQIITPAALAKLKQADPDTRAKAITLLQSSLQTLKQADAALAKTEAQALQLPQRSRDAQLSHQAGSLLQTTSQQRWSLQQQMKAVETTLTELQAAAPANHPTQ
jgi:hypothetical protein